MVCLKLLIFSFFAKRSIELPTKISDSGMLQARAQHQHLWVEALFGPNLAILLKILLSTQSLTVTFFPQAMTLGLREDSRIIQPRAAGNTGCQLGTFYV